MFQKKEGRCGVGRHVHAAVVRLPCFSDKLIGKAAARPGRTPGAPFLLQRMQKSGGTADSGPDSVIGRFVGAQ